MPSGSKSTQGEERFRFLAESIPQMVWTATPDGLLDYVNSQTARYFAEPVEALLGMGWLAGVHPEDQERATERWTHSLRTGAGYETQFRLRRGADACWRVHLVRAVPMRSEAGQIQQWFGTCTDIEDQHQAALQIEEDRRRWRELLLQTPAAIAVLRGPQHIFEWVNPEGERLLGRTADLLLGKPLRQALPEVAAHDYAALLDAVFESGEPFRATEALLHLGADPDALQEYYVDCVMLPTKDSQGKKDGIFVHAVDVTERMAGRRIIEESEIQFRVLAETIPHLTWMADETGHIFWYNQRWYSYTGTTFEDMEGWGWASVHDPEVLPQVLTNWREAIASGQPLDMIFPLRRADGEFRPFLTRVEPIKVDGKVVRWFGTNTDISEQRKTEEQLRRINRDLEEFAYVASHDLQEPLRMVNIYTELLVKEKNASSGDVEIYAGFVSEGVKRMELLIQDLLSFSRNVHTEEPMGNAADLGAVLHDALGVLKNRIQETGAVITATALPCVRGDSAQLSHVFQNVLSNALKYRKNSEIPRIHVTAEPGDLDWTVSIQDNGIGFEPQYADRIFGLFKRLHKDAYPGTGLGLAICKRIVERCGGRMWAHSALGQGSTFYFSLPRAIDVTE